MRRRSRPSAASTCCSPTPAARRLGPAPPPPPPRRAAAPLGCGEAAGQTGFELLLMSVIRTVRLVVPSMRARRGGAILVGTSSTVKEPVPNLALSNVMRAGVTAAVKTLSLELAPDNIRINTLLPGRIATD